jgi:hypothetical protein
MIGDLTVAMITALCRRWRSLRLRHSATLSLKTAGDNVEAGVLIRGGDWARRITDPSLVNCRGGRRRCVNQRQSARDDTGFGDPTPRGASAASTVGHLRHESYVITVTVAKQVNAAEVLLSNNSPVTAGVAAGPAVPGRRRTIDSVTPLTMAGIRAALATERGTAEGGTARNQDQH